MELIEVRNTHCTALVSTQGAQLLQWQPHSQAIPVLWCADPVHWAEGKPIRGGIPLCWPWFGKSKQPAHGFARTLPWRLASRIETLAGTTLSFELTDTPVTRTLWPHPFLTRLTMELGASCKLSLNADCTEPSTGALHSYFQVGDIEHVEVTGLGRHYLDALSGLQLFSAPDRLRVKGSVDRIYTEPEPTSMLHDSALDRSLAINHQQHSDVVLWNPWELGAAALADMSNDAYRQMLCIETAAISQPISQQLALTISAHPLNPSSANPC
tara:strand:+ start:40 stop:846 length:807 start_codon:yes stop_codon:yes gene_type:complete